MHETVSVTVLHLKQFLWQFLRWDNFCDSFTLKMIFVTVFTGLTLSVMVYTWNGLGDVILLLRLFLCRFYTWNDFIDDFQRWDRCSFCDNMENAKEMKWSRRLFGLVLLETLLETLECYVFNTRGMLQSMTHFLLSWFWRWFIQNGF